MYTKKTVYTKKTNVNKKNKQKQTYICFILFFLCTQILGLIISHCARKPVFGMRWILDLELLPLISCIAPKWNRAKTFFVCSYSPPENPFLLRQEVSRERGLWLLNSDYKNMFLLVQTYLGGAILLFPPHLTPQIQCLPEAVMVSGQTMGVQ
jgi:hypothetical protein